MSTLPPDLDFLSGEPAPVGEEAGGPSPDDLLPPSVADALLRLDGVVGAWIERDAQGRRFVALHLDHAGPAPHLPATAHGLPTRVVGGAPIRAGL
jgi:hypothetical protein